jgi:peptide/nickel transport system substrate-binding protein
MRKTLRFKIIQLSLMLVIFTSLLAMSCSSASSTPTQAPASSVPVPAPASSSAVPKPAASSPSVPSTPTTPAPATTANSPSSSKPTSSAVFGGTLKIIQPPSLANLGYPGAIDQPNDPIYSRPAVETLVGMDPNGTGNPVPLLATSWQYSSDGKSLTFNLRKGVKFQDGTDFNADAVKYCLDAFKKGPKKDLNSVSSIDVLDQSTVRLNLSSYDPALLSNMSNDRASMIVSPTAVQQMGQTAAMLRPVGTGPFKFVSYQQDMLLKYDRFDGYWGGKPYLDAMQFVIVADNNTAVMVFKSGDAQVLRRVNPSQARDLQNAGYVVKSTPSNILGLTGDSKNASSPFANLKVRQAVAYAIDTKSINQNLNLGLYTLTNQWAIPGAQAYNPNVAGYPYDAKKAKQLLAEAGYANGFSTKLTFDNGGSNANLWAAVQANLADIGINLTLDSAPTARAVDLTTQGWNNQMVYYRLNLGIGVDVGSALAGFMSSKPSNFVSVLAPADYDTKLAQANKEIDPVKRAAALQELSKMIIDTYCLATPLYASQSLWVAADKVHDLDISTYSAYDWRPEKVWLSP